MMMIMRFSRCSSWCVILLLLLASWSVTAWSAAGRSSLRAHHDDLRRSARSSSSSVSFSSPSSLAARVGKPRGWSPCGGDGGSLQPPPSIHPHQFFELNPTSRRSTTRLYQSVGGASPKQVATRAAVETARSGGWPPSKATVIAWVLAALLLRERWSKTPVWLQKLLLWPFKKLVATPLRKLRRRFWKSQSVMVAGNESNRAVTDSEDRIEQAKGKVQFFTDSSDGDVDDDDEADTVVGKLSAVMALAQSTTDTVQFEGFQLQGALLASLQMVQDSKRTTAELWDQFYESSGRPLFVNRSITGIEAAADILPGENTETAAAPSIAMEVEDSPDARAKIIEKWIDLLHLADWAYLKETNDIRTRLKELAANNTDNDWSLIRHVKTDEPGRVGHYLALDSQSKTALISVKGTSALSDMITDACGLPVRFNVTELNENGEADTYSTVSCHEGILDASLALVDDVQPLVEHLFLPAGYRVLLIGHSLGAGVACMVGKLLRSRIPALRQEQDFLSKWLPFQRTTLPLEVVAFAPPPMLDLGSATATSTYTTSIVNNDDLIPRASISNLVSLLRFLKIVDERLAEKGLRLEGPKGAVELLKRILASSRKSDDKEQAESLDDTIMTAQEIFDGINEAGAGDGEDYQAEALKDMDHLFVPGKVVVVYEKHVQSEESTKEVDKKEIEDSTAEEKLTEALQDESKKVSQGIPTVEDLGSIISNMLSKKEEKEDQESEVPIDAGAVVSDGTALVLRHININQRMVGDHMPDAYEKTLRGLM